jgi:Ras family protein T1
MPSGSVAELSAHGYQFLTDLFQSCDLVGAFCHECCDFQDKDGALNAKELKDLYSITPGIPWLSSGFPYSCITSDDGAVTLQGFLAMWRYIKEV